MPMLGEVGFTEKEIVEFRSTSRPASHPVNPSPGSVVVQKTGRTWMGRAGGADVVEYPKSENVLSPEEMVFPGLIRSARGVAPALPAMAKDARKIHNARPRKVSFSQFPPLRRIFYRKQMFIPLSFYRLFPPSCRTSPGVSPVIPGAGLP